MFELREGLIIALKAVAANKMRSALTTVGIVIGVTAVVLMSTAIKGIDNAFEGGISSLGADVLYIAKWEWFSDKPWWEMRRRDDITMDEYRRFASLVKLPAATAPYIIARETVKYEDNNIGRALVTGTTERYLATTNFEFAQGRFFTAVESSSSRYVAVLGSTVAENLFPRGDALGKEVKIGGHRFRVVGVLEEQGSFLLGDFNPDQRLFIPIGVSFKHFSSRRHSSITITVKAASPELVDDTREEALGAMRKVRGLKYDDENDFGINQQDALMETYNSTVGVIQIGGYFITGLSLFVGAIGIMNIMFVSVRERTREIGVRKAIGAKRRTILAQFLLESSVICVMGGLIGLGLAVILSLFVDQVLPTSVQLDAAILAIVISAATGVAAGVAPAYAAAKLDPVDALRYE